VNSPSREVRERCPTEFCTTKGKSKRILRRRVVRWRLGALEIGS
jgi:hypothetical protein